MKKALFLFAAIIAASITIYSCQKDNAEQVIPVSNTGDPNLAVTSRDYASCEDCYEDCYDCCILLECLGGFATFAFIDPTTGNVVTRKFTPVTAQSAVVCAAGGYFAFLCSGGSGRATVCSTGQAITKTGVNDQGGLDVETCTLYNF
jgi:hypothetical protein